MQWLGGKTCLGSSPRVRGTPRPSRRTRTGPRIIPACAGNTSPKSSTNACRRDHPRVCGEHSYGLIVVVFFLGSSPRVRGTHALLLEGGVAVGDHPRVCGEHSGRGLIHSLSWGSSPRVRGTLQPAFPEPFQRCGQARMAVGVQGSSPRVRGTRLCGLLSMSMLGIIPACAGNTAALTIQHRALRDHPRVCGEHSEMLLLQLQNTGSSPRVRGTPMSCGISCPSAGIIPACAGNTL